MAGRKDGTAIGDRGHTTPATLEKLSQAWQRVLRCSSIDTDDNFFDRGGDPELAIALFAEISRTFGVELAPERIYQAPTLASQAALLNQPVIAAFPPVIPLKGGTKQPPVFLAHGVGGTVMELFQVVKHIQSLHAIYGLQASGVDGSQEPLERVEDAAEFHLDGIRNVQPHGPYLLVGYSFGGLVMLEIAQRLIEQKERIGLLAMVDAYPHQRYLPPGQRLLLASKVTARRAASVIRGVRRSGGRSGSIPVTLSPAAQRVRESGYRALSRYRPRFYRGTIRFVKAEIPSAFPEDPVAVWGPLAEKVELETVPGNHQGMVREQSGKLASVLSRYLTEAGG
jgi:acetoacetyl-CoA synthetase